MKITYLLTIALVAMIVSSCTTTRTTTAKRMDIYGSGVIQFPVVANLDVSSTKVTGTASSSIRKMTVRDVRNNAIANALKKVNADILIEPVFETETKQGVTTVHVSGFPGTYESFREASNFDVPLLELGVLQVATVAEPMEEEKKSGLAITLGAIGGLGLIALLLALL